MENIQGKILLKKVWIFILLVMLLTQANHASDIALGFHLGYRQLKDPDLKEIYGDGFVFSPYVSYFPLPHYGIDLSYEGGYKKDSPIGLFQEDSTLSVSGIQFCGIIRYPIWKILPYFKFGVGYFSYKQDIQSEFVRFKVDHHKWATIVGGGIRVDLYKGLFLTAEVRYVPLKVQPFDIPVDLGGLRYLAGVGFRITL
jgi:hypothetical protein